MMGIIGGSTLAGRSLTCAPLAVSVATPRRLLCLFSLAQVLIYYDRGLIAGFLPLSKQNFIGSGFTAGFTIGTDDLFLVDLYCVCLWELQHYCESSNCGWSTVHGDPPAEHDPQEDHHTHLSVRCSS